MKKYLFPLIGILIFGGTRFNAYAGADGPYDWRGFYLGGHVGYCHANEDISVHDPGPINASPTLGSLFGGLQFGYNYVFPSRILIGGEADIMFPNAYPSDAEVWRGTTPSILAEQLDYIATLRARFGYAFDRTLLYATGGFAVSSGHFVRTDLASGSDEVHGRDLDRSRRWPKRFNAVCRRVARRGRPVTKCLNDEVRPDFIEFYRRPRGGAGAGTRSGPLRHQLGGPGRAGRLLPGARRRHLQEIWT